MLTMPGRMKISALTPGMYFDGRKGLRLFIRRDGDQAVYQKVISGSAGPQVQERTLFCPIADFARWADRQLQGEQIQDTALAIAARTVTLSPEQARALRGLTQGIEVRGKVRTSLLEKDLVSCKDASSVLPRLTELGNRVLNRLDAPPEKSA